MLLLDNHDSFTWNLHHVLQPLVEELDVVRNDAITVAEAATYDRLVLTWARPSFGVGCAHGRGARTAADPPMLGVCLGMQALVEVCGGSLFQQTEVMHGRVADCPGGGTRRSALPGLPARGSPWASTIPGPPPPATLPAELQVTARSERGVIMAVGTGTFRHAVSSSTRKA